MQRYIAIGISFPREIIIKIDTERGDIPRSRYLLRMIENTYKENRNGKNSQNLLDSRAITFSQENPYAEKE